MKPSLTILVVDDSQPMPAILAAVLASAGHDVVQFNSASVARRMLAVRSPDLILTDYDMPGGRVVEPVRWVRTREVDDRAAINVVWSELNAALHTRMARAGIGQWIAKPVCVASLIAAVDTVCGLDVSTSGGPSARPDRRAFTPPIAARFSDCLPRAPIT